MVCPDIVADWSLAQTSVHGLTSEPDRVSVVLDKPSLARPASPAAQTLASAEHLELHARQAPRLPQDPPVLDLALDLKQALLPAFAQVPEGPIDAEIAATLRGLTDLRPKPLPALQAKGVSFNENGFPGFKTVDHVCLEGSEKAA